MATVNVGFFDVEGKLSETQLDIEDCNTTEEEVVELFNLLLSLKDELGLEKIEYLEYLETEEDG